MSNKVPNPTKNTNCALGMGLKLDLETLEVLLSKAGLGLSDAKPFDLAIRYFFENGMYNVMENNMILFDNGLEQLGNVEKES